MESQELRCNWCLGNEEMIHYHDTEWGFVVTDDTLWFEYLVLDAFQAGLSWKTILLRRDNFRRAFDNFDVLKIAQYTPEKIEELMQDRGIIRNRLKVESTVTNAQKFLEIQAQYGSFSKFIWQFTNGKMLVNQNTTMKDIPASSVQSDNMSKALKKLGFKFVGSTICYAFMQAAGMVNDHLISCPQYEKVISDAKEKGFL